MGEGENPNDPRNYFAAERTLLAWIRTGLAMMGFGFVVARFGLFLREITSARANIPSQHPSLSLWLGTALVLLGVAVNAVSAYRYGRILRQLARGESPRIAGFPTAVVVSLILVVIGIATAVYLIVMR